MYQRIFSLICCCVSGCLSRILGPKVDLTTGVYRGDEIGTSRRVLKVSLVALFCIHVSLYPDSMAECRAHAVLNVVWCGGAYCMLAL